jgi:hypothetical protein
VKDTLGLYYLAEKSRMENKPAWSFEKEDAMEFSLEDAVDTLTHLQLGWVTGQPACFIEPFRTYNGQGVITTFHGEKS